jgi:methylated-DNA-[protein]-cysteine S-methyltransferase
MPQLSLNTPIGALTLTEEDGRIISLDWGWGCLQESTPLLESARAQLEEYFAGQRHDFDLPLDPPGTAFQRKVWAALAAIPYGAVRRYGELASELGTAPRALGGACGRNPIPILIPCHRVVAQSGELGGYSGLDGVDTKRFLLRLEGCPLVSVD